MVQKFVLDWQSRRGRRSAGRPTANSIGDLRKVAGNVWMQKAQSRGSWRAHIDAYACRGCV